MLSLEDFKKKLSEEDSVKWKSDYCFENFWCFEVNGNVDEVWAYLSDTSRFNREVGFDGRESKEVDGNTEVTTRMLGIQQIWIEEPWNWVYGKTIVSNRVYKKGMAKTVHSVFHIEPVPERGLCRVYIFFGWQIYNPFWRVVIRVTSPIVKYNFQKTFDKVSGFLSKNKGDFSGRALKGKLKTLSEKQQRRMRDLLSTLTDKIGNAGIAAKLGAHISTGDDFELESIRALKLASEWNENSKEVIKTCLHATKLGLLNISWNVVCPHCRGPRFNAETLGDIPEQSSCESCDLNFTTAEPDVVEIVFKVNKAVRDVPDVLYCAAEPAKKVHIKIHQVIAPGESFKFSASFGVGYYRARSSNSDEYMIYLIQEGCDVKSSAVFIDSVDRECKVIGASTILSVKNSGSAPLDFTFEELQWNKYMLRPAQIFLISEFRDLFSDEHLNSTVKLHLGEQTILFTDIVGSTKFYERVGDAKAFAEVRTHFQEIFADVKKYEGAVVKTIGDAVMATFPSLQDAFEAACAIQKRFYEGRSDLSIRVRISIHKGVVIAVQLNTGIDYFGTVVNSGAKIQSLAGAGEIALASRYCDELKIRLGPAFNYPIAEKSQSEDSFGFPVRVISIN